MLFAGGQKGVSRCRYGGTPKQQAEGCKKIHAGSFLFIIFQIFYSWYCMYKGHRWIQLSSGLADVLLWWLCCASISHRPFLCICIRSALHFTSNFFHADFPSHLIGSYSRREKTKLKLETCCWAGRSRLDWHHHADVYEQKFFFYYFFFDYFPSLNLSCVAVQKYNNKFLLFSCDVFLDTFCF